MEKLRLNLILDKLSSKLNTFLHTKTSKTNDTVAGLRQVTKSHKKRLKDSQLRNSKVVRHVTVCFIIDLSADNLDSRSQNVLDLYISVSGFAKLVV